MNCPKCGHKLIPLFTSVVCDYCEKRSNSPAPIEGWIRSLHDTVHCGLPYAKRTIYTSADDIHQLYSRHALVQRVRLCSPVDWGPSDVWGIVGDYTMSCHMYSIFPTKDAMTRLLVDPYRLGEFDEKRCGYVID